MFSCLSEISVLKRSYDFFLYLKPFCKKLLNLVSSLLMNILCQLNKVTQDFICICRQKTFSPVLSINSSQTDKASDLFKLPNRISSSSSCISGTARLIIYEISLFVTTANRETITRVWRRSLGGTGGASVNSNGYPDFE